MIKKIILFIAFVILSNSLFAQIEINGKVLYKNNPIENATVFLSNTTNGTITNQNGEFKLNTKEGSYELIISYLGFKTIKYILNTNNNKVLTFTLVEQQTMLNEVVIQKTKYDEDWKYNLSVFEKGFIGKTKFAKDCKILNPKVLSFEFNSKENILTAHAKEPLIIINKALGYEINYTLETFTINKNKRVYAGYSKYEILKGGKSKQKKWKQNRLTAYNGSTMHFFQSILKNTTKEDGFIINQFSREKNKERPSEEEIKKSRQLLKLAKIIVNLNEEIINPKNAIDSALAVLQKTKLPKFIDYLYKSDIPSSNIISFKKGQILLDFENNLNIVYTKEVEEEGYILRKAYSTLREPLPQTSYIIPIVKPSIIHKTGVLNDPLDVFYEGYWSYEKLANTLPLNYDPIE